MIRSSFLATSIALVTSTSQPASAQTPALSLRLAANPNDTFSSAYFAQDMGFFTQAGLTVDLQTISTGAAIAAGVVSGALDVGVATPVTIAKAFLRGLPLVFVAAGSIASKDVAALRLCTSKTSTLRTAKDLEGRVVGLNALGVGFELNLAAWFAQSGADVTKLKLVEIPTADMGAALDRSTIDAAAMLEPAYTVAHKQYGVQMISNLSAALGSRYLNSGWFTTRDFAQKNRDLIRRFARAIYATQSWADRHQAESATILAKYSKMDVELVRAMTRSPWAEQMHLEDIQTFLDVAAKYGILASAVSASSLVYQS